MIKLGLAEDNSFSLKAIEEKLSVFEDVEIVFTAKNGQEAINNTEQHSNIDLLLMDIEMPVMNGIEATSIIKQKYPHIKIVMVTIYDDDEYIFNSIKAGADSYILKEIKSEKMYETIIDTLNGGAVMSPSVALKALKQLKNPSSLKSEQKIKKVTLTERETQILEQLSGGSTNKRIAEILFISPFTVKRHIENIYQKIQAQTRVELVEKAKRSGLL